MTNPIEALRRCILALESGSVLARANALRDARAVLDAPAEPSAQHTPTPGPWKCDVCERESAQALWGNRVLLGADDKLCARCFAIWYDGVTDLSEIKRLSREARNCHEER